MPAKPDFDTAAAHKYFAAHCFNQAWDLMEKQARTAEDERLMVALNQASLYHWMQRSDCDDMRLSVGYWQASRIQCCWATPTQRIVSRRFAMLTAATWIRSYLGYAFEALARAAAVGGDAATAATHTGQGEGLCRKRFARGRSGTADERPGDL